MRYFWLFFHWYIESVQTIQMCVIVFHKLTPDWLQETTVVVTNMGFGIMEDCHGQTKRAPSWMAQSQESVPGACQAGQDKVSRVGRYSIYIMLDSSFC